MLGDLEIEILREVVRRGERGAVLPELGLFASSRYALQRALRTLYLKGLIRKKGVRVFATENGYKMVDVLDGELKDVKRYEVVDY